MGKLLLSAAVGLVLLGANANAASREHRAGQPGYTPGGGVTLGTPGGGRGGRGARNSSQPAKVMPAPNVPHEKNFGIYPGARNVRDHRSCLGPGAGPCAGAAPR